MCKATLCIIMEIQFCKEQLFIHHWISRILVVMVQLQEQKVKVCSSKFFPYYFEPVSVSNYVCISMMKTIVGAGKLHGMIGWCECLKCHRVLNPYALQH